MLSVLKPISNLTNTQSLNSMITPNSLNNDIPITANAKKTVALARDTASRIMNYADNRLLVIVGPCSIHDVESALEYGTHLKHLVKQYKNELCIIMRTYFEKPRTTIGWKGLINDPYLDNSFQINHGLRLARQLLLDLAEMGVPSATEFLNTIISTYIADLIAWGAIGARTTESQQHRELASSLAMPVGFKNSTDGNINIAINAILSAQNSHHTLHITEHGNLTSINTSGNYNCHTILRGATNNTNYSAQHIMEVAEIQNTMNIKKRIMIDCSHGNSQKDHRKQKLVIDDLTKQINNGSQFIGGVMLESNLVEGKQALTSGKKLVYGQSITDACIAWDETVVLLDKLAQAVKVRNQSSSLLVAND